MTVATNAGNKFYVSTTATPPATYDALGYAALTYAEVGEITDLGTLTAEYAVTEHNPIGDRNLQKLKGTRDNGSQDLTLGFDTVDAGQIVMQTALDSDSDYHFKIALKSGDVVFYSGLVTNFNIVFGLTATVIFGTEHPPFPTSDIHIIRPFM